MDKKTFHKKWYFLLLQVIFLGFFIFFIILGILYWLIMRNKGSIGGFVFGVIACLLLLFIISKFNPGDEIAGIVIFTLLISGLFFAFIGYLIQNCFRKKDKKIQSK